MTTPIPATPLDKLMETILAEFAEFEQNIVRRRLSESGEDAFQAGYAAGRHDACGDLPSPPEPDGT